ncbi:flagellar hook assembly protein FlgD [Roseibium sp. RKSG952]|uniref:flagellar hook assembly protein FlgD n=1 Tax=Roseibium sp. RKSG952 TaxID=2529384 RepID=UPI0012BD15C5|nr:flagellar hook capping FlgD N-terminal domain-containing protein [Roseibium sp. RKSG952]MTH97457.1 flagellar biosynthesis protein FlgD [Roseibium sp. RKSG952]
MSISTTNSFVSTSATSTSASSSSSGLDITSTDFLNLMVDQLLNQDPLDPTDTDEYLNQLVSFASYDTQAQISEQLTQITDTLSSSISSAGLGYLGQTVEAYGNTTTLSDGAAEWSYTLDKGAASVTVSILDEDGTEVWSGDGNTAAGNHAVTWDGVASDGTQLEDGGIYTISVNAFDEDGKSINGTTTVTGTVTGIDVTDGESVLKIGDASVLVDNVLSIQAG